MAVWFVYSRVSLLFTCKWSFVVDALLQLLLRAHVCPLQVNTESTDLYRHRLVCHQNKSVTMFLTDVSGHIKGTRRIRFEGAQLIYSKSILLHLFFFLTITRVHGFIPELSVNSMFALVSQSFVCESDHKPFMGFWGLWALTPWGLWPCCWRLFGWCPQRADGWLRSARFHPLKLAQIQPEETREASLRQIQTLKESRQTNKRLFLSVDGKSLETTWFCVWLEANRRHIPKKLKWDYCHYCSNSWYIVSKFGKI